MKKTFTKHTWTQEDLAFLRRNYSSMSAQEIASHVGSSAQSVKVRACRMKLTGMRTIPKNWTSEQYQTFAEEYLACKDLNTLSKKIGKSVMAMQQVASTYGLSRREYQREQKKKRA